MPKKTNVSNKHKPLTTGKYKSRKRLINRVCFYLHQPVKEGRKIGTGKTQRLSLEEIGERCGVSAFVVSKIKKETQRQDEPQERRMNDE